MAKTLNATTNVTRTETGRSFDRTRHIANSNGAYTEETVKGLVTRNSDGSRTRSSDVQGTHTNAKGKTVTYTADRNLTSSRNADGSRSYKASETRNDSNGRTTRRDVEGTSVREGNKIKRTAKVTKTRSGGKNSD